MSEKEHWIRYAEESNIEIKSSMLVPGVGRKRNGELCYSGSVL